MGFKKKNVIVLSLVIGICFILYQVYFFLTITAETNNGQRIINALDHTNIEEFIHIRSEEDKNVNNHGVIKGVLLANMPHYRPNTNNQFRCLTVEKYIPFQQVNDDYCDCDDFSDEPSTSACANGTFYCDTQYQSKPTSINVVPSSKVNDGICDCCDGSDEWLHNSKPELLTQGSMKRKRYYASQCLNIC